MLLKTTSGSSWVVRKDENILPGHTPALIPELQHRIYAAQVWFFDLDDTQANSPGKEVIRAAIGTHHYSPQYLLWLAGTGLKALGRKKQWVSSSWQQYVNTFLRSEPARAEVLEKFDLETVRSSLYQGVQSFCDCVSHSQRYYVSRNIKEIVESYAYVLGFDGFFYEAFQKGKVVEDFIRQNPALQRYGVEGDSEEDGEMIDLLTFYRKEIISLQVMKSLQPEKMDSRFEYALGRDHRGLVELLTG